MIHLFNRKELYLTFDQNDLYRIQNALHDGGMDYRLSVKSHSHTGAGGRTAIGSYRSDPVEYKFYVRKADYDKARHLIGK